MAHGNPLRVATAALAMVCGAAAGAGGAKPAQAAFPDTHPEDVRIFGPRITHEELLSSRE